MLKKITNILIIGYSQTGQLQLILDSIERPLKNQQTIKITRKFIEPKQEYSFPWPFFDFLDVFPECVHLDAPKNKKLNLTDSYDLVILGYQPWFLSPSLPTTAFLKSKEAKEALKGVPIITVIGCRNMWVQSQLKVSQMLGDIGAKLIDNIVLTDSASSLATFITTPRWLLTGKKDSFLRLPKPGILDKDIKSSERFGRAILKTITRGGNCNNGPMLTGLKAAKVNVALLKSEIIGSRSFFIWGKLLRFIAPRGSWKRKPVLLIYIIFLITMIITVVPINLFIRSITNPFFKNKIKEMERQFELPSGSEDSRMQEFL